MRPLLASIPAIILFGGGLLFLFGGKEVWGVVLIALSFLVQNAPNWITLAWQYQDRKQLRDKEREERLLAEKQVARIEFKSYKWTIIVNPALPEALYSIRVCNESPVATMKITGLSCALRDRAGSVSEREFDYRESPKEIAAQEAAVIETLSLSINEARNLSAIESLNVATTRGPIIADQGDLKSLSDGLRASLMASNEPPDWLWTPMR